MELVRLTFSKKDEASYISHLDLQRVMSRAIRKSGFPAWYSQGFNPHIYMSFALPLPLFQHSETEFMDCKTEADLPDYNNYIELLNKSVPMGLEFYSIYTPVNKAEEIASAEYYISYNCDKQDFENAVQKYNQAESALVTRRTKRSEQQVDLKENLKTINPLETDGFGFNVTLPAGNKINYNPELLTGFLEELSGLEANKAYILRKKVMVQDGGLFK